ncbi:UPF0047 protein-like protein, partial [Tanacetum coccineum]
SNNKNMSAPKWAQKTITLPPHNRGCHLITPKHTSASLTINENYDSDVRADTETFLNAIVPEGRSAPWKHTLEGPDDMPAHIKSSMFGCALTVPITNGKLNMGTWQGIWLCEHRDEPTAHFARKGKSSMGCDLYLLVLVGLWLYLERHYMFLDDFGDGSPWI